MIRLFLDANILVSVLNKEYPLFTYSSRILSLASGNEFEVYTSPICLAIAFYYAEKKHKTIAAKQKVDMLCQYIKISENLEHAVRQTLSNKKVHDFEDGLEYYAAVNSKCHCIITENVKDFYFSDIKVLTCKDFFKQYLL